MARAEAPQSGVDPTAAVDAAAFLEDGTADDVGLEAFD